MRGGSSLLGGREGGVEVFVQGFVGQVRGHGSSGLAGEIVGQQLAGAGHDVHVFEKYARAGGLLRYGIPDFKMEKHVIDRRVAQMEAEGVIFRTNMEIGVSVSVQRLLDDYDVLVMAGGAPVVKLST